MMNYSQDFEINKIEFNNFGLNSIQSQYFVAENWPIVYILNNDGVKQAYVGETTDTYSRMFSHLQSQSKNQLKEAHFISSKKFNKSATLDIESNLIKYLHADGKFKLLNGNLGLVNHSYYQREEYYSSLFREIWNSLISKGIASHSLEYISNSDLFKYSPYKTLSSDQKRNLMLIIDALISDSKKSIFVEGGAGTGKTIIAIFLFKLMLTSHEDFNYKEFGEDELEFIDKVKLLRQKYPSPKMGLIIAMSSFRKTLKNVFNNIEGLNQKMVIGPSDLSKAKYDIVFVDEAHRLRKRVNLTNYASFDNTAKALGLIPNETNELEWTQLQSLKALYFYDPKQSIKPSDVNPEEFNLIKQSSNSKTVQLYSQFRSKGGNGYVKFVDDLLDQKISDDNFKYSNKNYEVLLFDNFKDFVSELRLKNTKHQLSRFVAGYGWQWISKNDKSKYDIVIDGLRFQWNHDNIEYILKDVKAEQIGCIHTTQGYDLNYVGLIFGPEIILNPITNQIEILQKNYYDTNGQNTITDINVLKQYIINIYKTIMLRGILGCYFFVTDENLRNYFKKHIYIFNEKKSPIIDSADNEEVKLIPFENSVPLYSLKVAAGEFKFNDNIPEEDFILVPEGIKITKDHFACKIIGNSMNKIVQDGQIALFKWYKGGTRNGLMVIAEYYDHQDIDNGSCYTFKEYYSQKAINEESWFHEKIILKPKSFDSSYQDIVIDPDSINEKAFSVKGIFDRVLE
ncbi:DNA/RNA helicase domain-containing protein [Lacihabitans sp. CS3-21]|uniref:DNA/RNA helicase domain-containing protein n=1 Tax=Lacihabitans sp. CS3-21 TaxID=2487332 RepID=UPI0020CD32E0|nr:DNA/RNA helicase domain-containing protein [Lacihabitans sp. CS3-21]